MLKGAFEDIGENLHVPVRMGGKATTGGDAILIDDAKGAKTHVGGIMVARETETMLGIQPTVIGVATIFRFADGDSSLVSFHGIMMASGEGGFQYFLLSKFMHRSYEVRIDPWNFTNCVVSSLRPRN